MNLCAVGFLRVKGTTKSNEASALVHCSQNFTMRRNRLQVGEHFEVEAPQDICFFRSQHLYTTTPSALLINDQSNSGWLAGLASQNQIGEVLRHGLRIGF
jgi:hypothetical protein